MLPSEIPNSPQTRWWEGFLVFGNFSFTTPSLGWMSIPNSFASLFIFYILSYLLLKSLGCLFGCLVSSASIQKLFCGICSAFKWSFNEFGWESGLPVLFICHLRTASPPLPPWLPTFMISTPVSNPVLLIHPSSLPPQLFPFGSHKFVSMSLSLILFLFSLFDGVFWWTKYTLTFNVN